MVFTTKPSKSGIDLEMLFRRRDTNTEQTQKRAPQSVACVCVCSWQLALIWSARLVIAGRG